MYEREIRKKTGALDSIKDEIDRRRKKINELEKAEGNYLARLEYLQTNIEASQQYLVLLSSRIDTAETTIVRLTDSLTQAKHLLSDRQTVMRQRLRHAYMAGTVSPIMVLVLSKDPLDAIHRVRYVEALHRYDLELVGKITRIRQNIDAKKRSFEEERTNLARLLAEKKKEQSMLLREEDARRTILSDIQSKKKANTAIISELEVTQRQLNDIIRVLEEKRKNAALAAKAANAPSVFESRKGSLPWPIPGSVAARFGKIVHPLYKTVTMNNGIDISGRPGQKVQCVANGTVIYIGSMRGLGRLVIIDHGAGFITIYAGLGTIEVTQDQTVIAGSILGHTSTTGLSETPLVHFEIRKSTTSLDPMAWLEKKQD